MKEFLESTRDGLIIAGALLFVATIKVASALLGFIVATLAVVAIFAVAVLLVIRDLILSIKDK